MTAYKPFKKKRENSQKRFETEKYFFPPLNKKIASTKKEKSPRGASNYLLLLSCCKKSFCSQLLSGSFSSPALGLSCSPPADSRLFKQSADIPESRLGQSGGCRKEGRTCFLTSQPVTVISATHTEGGAGGGKKKRKESIPGFPSSDKYFIRTRAKTPVECISNYHRSNSY